jgi:hypothetical protein
MSRAFAAEPPWRQETLAWRWDSFAKRSGIFRPLYVIFKQLVGRLKEDGE